MRIGRTVAALIIIAFVSHANAQQSAPTSSNDSEIFTPAQANDVAYYFGPQSPLVASSTPAVATGQVGRHQVLASVDVRHRERRSIPIDAQSDHLRLASGTVLYRTQFRSTAAQSTPITAWCGSGAWRNLYGWHPRPVCLVESIDGQATLARAGEFEGGPEWYNGSLEFTDRDFRMPRPVLTPTSEGGPTLKLEILYDLLSSNVPCVYLRLRGPTSMGHDEVFLRQINLPTSRAQTRLVFGESTLVVNVSADRRSASALLEQGPVLASTPPMSSPPASDTPTIVRPERFIIGSARLDPASWSITPTSVSSGGVLARGFVGYARLGKLGTAIGFTSMVRFEAPAGLDVHRFQYFLRDGAGAGNIVELWCGQVSARFTVVSNRRTACLRPLGNGFMFYPTEEEHTTMMSSGSHFVYPDLVRNQRVTIVDQNTPAEMPFALSVILKGLSDRSADIEFSVRHDGDTTRIWRADVPLDAEGLAQLPLWTHTLQIRRIAQNSAQATLIPQGTGEGPVDRFPGGLP